MSESRIQNREYGVRSRGSLSAKGPLGFTLLELLIVIFIIAFLIAIMMPVTQNLRKKAKEKERDVTKKSLEVAVRAFRTEYGYWPTSDMYPDATTLKATNQTQYIVIKDYLLNNGSKNNHKKIFWEVDQVVTNVVSKQPFAITMDVVNDTVTVN